MNFTDNFSTIITIISILITLVTIVCSLNQAIHQTKITETLSTHENQVKNRLYRGIYFCFLIFIIIASIQFSGYVVFNILLNNNADSSVQIEQVINENEADEPQEEVAELEGKEADLEAEAVELIDDTAETNKERKHISLEKEEIVLIVFEFVIFLIIFAFTFKCFISFRKKNKEDFILKKEILGILSTILAVWAIVNIVAINFFIGFKISIIIVSAFIVYELAKSSYDSITKTDWFPAKNKTIYDRKELYIYEMQDDYLLTGKDRYLCNCEEFYLIKASEIKNKIVNSNSEIEIMEEEDKEKEIKELKKKIKELEFEIVEIKGLVKKNEKHSLFDKIRDFFE